MTAVLASIILVGLFCFSSMWLIWSRYNAKLHVALAELTKTHENEQKLREDIKELQLRVQHTVEDPVTQLPSWRLFEDRLQQTVKESARYQLVMGLLIVDLDEFKLVNSISDYKTGDAVLQEVANRLKRCIRQVDSVSRFNKDTFVVMIARLNKPETAAIVAQRILQSLVQPFEIKNESLRMTASIGIATFPQDGQDSAALMNAADHALQTAKSKGMHRYEFFQADMYNRSRRLLLLSSGLNSEDVVNYFTIRYQPIVNTLNEEIVCMDTLLSWEHAELGVIEANELFELAEKQQKLPAVAEWLVTSACQQFVRWRSLGFRPAMLGVSLPISVLQNSPFVCRLSQMMHEAGFDPSWMLLQVKSDAKNMSLDVLEKSFNMLRYLNVKLAIDEFGTGSLSLWQLKQFPVNYIKLDRALINDMTTNPQTAVIVQSTIDLTQTLGAQLIVQGVETPEQLALLKQAGCVLMEGKALGAPLTDNEVTGDTTISES
jgi:diguanylate cyclase (GGDEF)-like protein